MKVVLIPGLGYDSSLFENLEIKNVDFEILEWIEPRESEVLNTYAKRLFSPFKDEKKVIIIGHSLGGIVAQEIASSTHIDMIVLISSIKSRKEMPLWLRIISPLNMHKLFTKELSIKTIKYWGKSNGFKTKNEIDLFKRMLSNQSNVYLQWALKELSNWRGTSTPNSTKIVHIHGTNDKTFPFKLIKNPDFKIKNGSHIFVYNKSQESSDLINGIITKFSG